MDKAEQTKTNLKSPFGKIANEEIPPRNEGPYNKIIPNLLSIFAFFFFFFFSSFSSFIVPKNLEYCICFPLISENPAFANETTLIIDIVVTNKDGGGGYRNFHNVDITIFFSILENVKKKIIKLCVYIYNKKKKLKKVEF